MPSSSSDTRPNSPTLIIRNHIDYYIPGGDLFILIDGTLFRIHSYFFRCKSRDWQNLLGSTTRGHNANTPIVLNEEFALYPPATPTLFAQFLWVFYNPRYTIYEASEEMWCRIQSYAIQWDMEQVQDCAYRELDKFFMDNFLSNYLYSATTWNPLFIDPAKEALHICTP